MSYLWCMMLSAFVVRSDAASSSWFGLGLLSFIYSGAYRNIPPSTSVFSPGLEKCLLSLSFVLPGNVSPLQRLAQEILDTLGSLKSQQSLLTPGKISKLSLYFCKCDLESLTGKSTEIVLQPALSISHGDPSFSNESPTNENLLLPLLCSFANSWCRQVRLALLS